MELWANLPRLARRLGGDIYGVADLSSATEEIRRQGGDEVAGYPKAISVGVVLLDPLVDLLPRRDERAVAVRYHIHAYRTVNLRLDAIASRLGSELQKQGYRAFPIPASERADDERTCAIFSHKLAAHLAGLGWIGKSCLLITPGHGPRVRWATVLTDAPLPAGEPMEQRCGSCHECVDACPPGVIAGRSFVESEPREARYDAPGCQRYIGSMEQGGRPGVCGMCLYVCPHGRKKE